MPAILTSNNAREPLPPWFWLWLQIYELLLICDGEIEMPSDGFGETERHHRMIRGDPLYRKPQPSVAIMQTCKLANEETIPILWGKNSFAICLRKIFFSQLSHNLTTMQPLILQNPFSSTTYVGQQSVTYLLWFSPAVPRLSRIALSPLPASWKTHTKNRISAVLAWIFLHVIMTSIFAIRLKDQMLACLWVFGTGSVQEWLVQSYLA